MDYPQNVTEDEIEEVIAKTYDRDNRFPAMSYEDGIRYALQWILDGEEEPEL